MLRTFFVFVALFMLTLVFAAFTPPASAQERPPLVVNVYSFTDMADVNPWDAVSRVVAPGEPAVEYHFDPALEIDKANGCHPAQVRRMSVVTFISSWCQATECCHLELRVSPSGWPYWVQECSITEVHGCQSFPLPPPPPPQ